MTYNFDPYQWYDNEREALELLYSTGKISQKKYFREIKKLDERFDDMLDRLDGTYRIPE